jgi:hypothetical protein
MTISGELETILAQQEPSGFTLEELIFERANLVRQWHTAQNHKQIFETEKALVALDVEIKYHPDNRGGAGR